MFVKECLLFEGVTQTKYTRLLHKSQVNGKIKSAVIYPPKSEGLVMARGSCKLTIFNHLAVHDFVEKWRLVLIVLSRARIDSS